MAAGSEFQEQVRQLGRLITQFDQMPEGPQKTACKELVHLLMDVHGAGLERIMEIVFEAAALAPRSLTSWAATPSPAASSCSTPCIPTILKRA